jgi:hypothetical protein
MSSNPYKLHRSIILSMRVNICSSGMRSYLKYSNAAGTLILLQPGFFKNSKSPFFKQFLVKTSLSLVCSNHKTFTPISELLALLNAIKRLIAVVGSLFATIGNIIIPNKSKIPFILKLAESFTILLLCIICLNVHKYVYLLFIIFIYFMRIKFIDS